MFLWSVLHFFYQNNKLIDIHEKQQEKLQREALKDEAAEMKKIQKEKQKWEKGKFALKSIVAEIDSKVVELGSVGGVVSFLFFSWSTSRLYVSHFRLYLVAENLFKLYCRKFAYKVCWKGANIPYNIKSNWKINCLDHDCSRTYFTGNKCMKLKSFVSSASIKYFSTSIIS